jgi:hypothetical protein
MHGNNQPNDHPSAQLPAATLMGAMLIEGVID